MPFFSKPRRRRGSQSRYPVAAVESLEDRVLLSGGNFAVHWHPVLHVVIDGQPQTVPANIGIQFQQFEDVHTHDTTGILHVESDTVRDFRLQEFFDTWDSAIADAMQGFGGSLAAVGHEARCRLIGANIQTHVEGAEHAGDFGSVLLRDGETIIINAITGARAFPPVLHDLTLDLSANSVVQSTGTLVTKGQSFTITGTTSAGARIDVARDADGAFNDGTVVAGANGRFSIDVTLAAGANPLRVRSTGGPLGLQETRDVPVHLAEGTVVRFNSSLGSVDFELFDDDAPQTVAAFLADLSRYDNSFVHRSVADTMTDFFIIQGGGFTVTADASGEPVVNEVTPFQPPPNEFRAENPNVRGTLSTAQVMTNIASFTGQFFVNVDDNPHLDNVPHAVFGRVIGAGMDVVDAINDLQTFDLSATFDEGALTDVPLSNFAAPETVLDVDDFVIFNRISRVEFPE